MAIYFIIFICLVTIGVFQQYTGKKYDRLFLFSVIFLILFSGLRGENVGFDYESYYDIFHSITEITTASNFLIEPLFALLVTIVNSVGSFNHFLIIIAILSISIKGFFIYRYSPYPLISILVYYVISFLINDMGQIRYGLAMSIVLLVFHELHRGKKLSVIILIFISILLHYSAVVVLPILLFYNYRFSNKQIFFILSASILFYIIPFDRIIISTLSLLPIPHVQSKIDFYTFYSDTFGRNLGFNMSTVLRLSVLLVFVKYKESLAIKTKTVNLFINVYLYGIVLYMMFNFNAEFAIRSSGYFKALDFIMIPSIVTLGRNKSDKLIIYCLIVIFSFYSLAKIMLDYEFGSAYLNYRSSIFQ